MHDESLDNDIFHVLPLTSGRKSPVLGVPTAHNGKELGTTSTLGSAPHSLSSHEPSVLCERASSRHEHYATPKSNGLFSTAPFLQWPCSLKPTQRLSPTACRSQDGTMFGALFTILLLAGGNRASNTYCSLICADQKTLVM